MLYAVVSIFFVEMNDCLGVALAAVMMAFPFQLGAQLLVIVDFSVVHDPNAAVFIADGLLAGSDINDAQAAHGQTDVFFHEESVVIGPAMNHLLVHRRQKSAIHPTGSIDMQNAANSTHS